MPFSRVLTFCLLLSLLPATALAHKIIVFAYMEGDELVAEASFPGGKPAVNTAVSLQDVADGSTLASGETDAEGFWRLPLPAAAAAAEQGLVVVLNAGEGHRAEWKLAPDEYLQHVAPTGGGQADRFPPPEGAAEAAIATLPPDDSPASSMSPEALQELVRRSVAEAVSRELAPLKRELLRRQQPGLRDILGGIGYLLGLAGLFAYARSRKS